MKTVDFYFDYVSPFSYFAWLRLQKWVDQGKIQLNPIPIPFGAILSHWGQLGPVEIKPKRTHVFKKIVRYAQKHQIPLEMPKFHPFNPILVLRLSLKDVCGSEQRKMVQTLWSAGWVRGIDMGSEEEVRGAIEKAGFDANQLIQKTKEPEIKNKLIENYQRAIDAGVFGVPTMIVDGESFWGNDSIDVLSDFLEDKDTLDKKTLDRFLARPKGVERKRS